MDINGKTADKNTFYVEEQGKVVLSLINNMISVYGMDFFRSPNCDFYIISPYRSVVEGLRNLINTKLISILPAASQLLRNGKLKSLDISNFLYRFKNENIITMEEFDIFGKAKEILLVLGCDRTSYNSVSMVNDVRVLNRMFSGVSGKIAVIGSSVVWSDTMLYKMIQEDFDVVRVK